MTKYSMLIDLDKCVGCSACQIACKVENSVGEGQFLCHHETVMSGEFPKVSYKYIPTMCNHCDNAPCVANCPVGALSKQDGLTIMDVAACIGCGMCGQVCPYHFSMKRSAAAYSTYTDGSAMLDGCTASGAEVAKATGVPVPYLNEASNPAEYVLDESRSIKCNFCEGRREQGEDPYCVHMCPAGARIWGDIEDPDSDISVAMEGETLTVSHPEYGTSPNVFYKGSFGK